jgi:hypothetical protein
MTQIEQYSSYDSNRAVFIIVAICSFPLKVIIQYGRKTKFMHGH